MSIDLSFFQELRELAGNFSKIAFGPAEAGGVLGAAKKYVLRRGTTLGAGYAAPGIGSTGGDIKYLSNVLADHGADVGKARSALQNQFAESPIAPWSQRKAVFTPNRGDGGSFLRSIAKYGPPKAENELLGHVNSMSPTERRTLDAVLKGHELDELQVPTRLAFTPFGHRSPDVVLREHNRVATLPADHANVRGAMQALREISKGEKRTLQEYGVQYGTGPRLSRHARKHITNMMEAEMLQGNAESLQAQASQLR